MRFRRVWRRSSMVLDLNRILFLAQRYLQMAEAARSIEMVSYTDSTPLLYSDIIEESESSSSAALSSSMKASVHIETPMDALPEKMISVTESKYVLRNGVLLWSDLEVEDEWGNPLYHVKTTGVFYISMKFTDLRTGHTAITLKQSSLFRPSYDIFLGDDKTMYANIAIRCSWTGLVVKFDNGEPDITIRASWGGNSYTFHRGDVLVVSAERGWCKHAYTIAAGENLLFFHSLIAAVDKLLTATKRKTINL